MVAVAGVILMFIVFVDSVLDSRCHVVHAHTCALVFMVLILYLLGRVCSVRLP